MALYGAVEALAFTAAGFLFGKEVHREQAQNAEKRADAKTAEAQAANKDAAEATARGRDLRDAIRAKHSSIGKGATLESLDAETGRTAADTHQRHLAELVTLAQSLFP